MRNIELLIENDDENGNCETNFSVTTITSMAGWLIEGVLGRIGCKHKG